MACSPWVRWLVGGAPIVAALATGSFTGLGTSTDDLLPFLARKAAHLAIYGVLGFASAVALRRPGRRGRTEVLAVALIVFVVAAADEFHQSFVPGRSGRPRDVAIDLVGGLIGLALTRWKFADGAT